MLMAAITTPAAAAAADSTVISTALKLQRLMRRIDPFLTLNHP